MVAPPPGINIAEMAPPGLGIRAVAGAQWSSRQAWTSLSSGPTGRSGPHLAVVQQVGVDHTWLWSSR